jgi:hypothetical protein
MKNSFRISVKEPCVEKFENFVVTPDGGFCDSCQKEVIDFITLSDKELLQHFNKNSNEVCGRFKKSQLKNYQRSQPVNANFISKSLGIVSFYLLALCAISNIRAQEATGYNSPLRTEMNGVQRLEAANNIIAEKYTVTGTVIDEEALPLAGVNVILKGTTVGVQTDFDGKFIFPSALEVDDTLVFSYIGYGKKEYTVTAGNSEIIDITITFDLSDIELMGEIVVGGAYKTKRNIFQKFIALFK